MYVYCGVSDCVYYHCSRKTISSVYPNIEDYLDLGLRRGKKVDTGKLLNEGLR
jgi:hypothetical protein